MYKRHLTDLSELIDPIINDRIAQIETEIEQNPEFFPVYADFIAQYKEAREAFESDHPGLVFQLDGLISTVRVCNGEISRAIYRQAFLDCAATLQKLFRQDCTKGG